MKKRTIFTNYKKWRDAELEALGRAVILAMINNVYFPTLGADVAKVAAAVEAFAQALATFATGNGVDRAIKEETRETLAHALHTLAVKVNLEADGNLAMLQSSGFPLTREVSAGKRARKDKVVLTGGRYCIGVSFGKIEEAYSYVIRYTEAPVREDSVWMDIQTGLTTHTINGLKAGTEYAVCLAIVTDGAPLMFSDPVTAYAVK